MHLGRMDGTPGWSHKDNAAVPSRSHPQIYGREKTKDNNKPQAIFCSRTKKSLHLYVYNVYTRSCIYIYIHIVLYIHITGQPTPPKPPRNKETLMIRAY